MRIKVMTAKEYAEIRGITIQAVSQAIKNNYNLPGLVSWVYFGRSYQLTVNMRVLEKFVRSQKKTKLHA